MEKQKAIKKQIKRNKIDKILNQSELQAQLNLALKLQSEFEKEIKTSRQCLDFQGIKCENKDCINLCCALNKKYE